MDVIRKIWKYLLLVVNVIKMTIFLILAQIIPSWKEEMTNDLGSVMEGSPLTVEDYEDTPYSISYLKQFWRARYLDIFKTAELHKPAPNATLISIDGNVKKELLDFQRKTRPLILNFGSCS